MVDCGDKRVRRFFFAALKRSRRPFDALCATAVRAWCWFLPPGCSPEQSEQAQRVLALCLGMCVWVAGSTVVYRLLDVPEAVHILRIAALLLAPIVLAFRYGPRPLQCGNLLVALALGMFTALALVTGGPTAPIATWFFSLPVIAILVTGAVGRVLDVAYLADGFGPVHGLRDGR